MAEPIKSEDGDVRSFEGNVNEAEERNKSGRMMSSGNDADLVMMSSDVDWCYEQQEIFLRPMCLICTTKEGEFSAEVEVLKQIEKIDAPLVVVAIAGLYRTGKSYLMNRLAGVSKGFPLGNTIKAKTKGIWAWCRKHPKQENTVLLLLDTEGLRDPLKGDREHDNKLFTLAVLLCNVLVYNIMNVANEEAIGNLAFISKISETISFKNKTGENDDGIDRIMPTFVLSLRDFTLRLEHEGKEITADQYLEILLELKPGSDTNTQSYNGLRKCVTRFFPNRKCFTFDVPGNRNVVHNLEELTSEKLNETFVKDTDNFLQYIYTLGSKRMLHSKHVTGTMFVLLVKMYVDAIRKGGVPNVDDAFEKVANIENERLVKNAVEEFNKSLQEIKLPFLKTLELDRLGRMKQNNALTRFRMEAVFNPKTFENKAQEEMDKQWEDLRAKNLELVKNHCEAALQEQYKKIGNKRSTGEYIKTNNGYAEYKRDIEAFKVTYRERTKGTDEYISQNVLSTFLEKEPEVDIVMANKKLNEEQKNSELKKIQLQNELERQKQEKMYEDQVKAEKALTEKYKSELEIEREKHEKILQKTKKETDNVVEKYREIAELLTTEKETANSKINELRNEVAGMKETIYQTEEKHLNYINQMLAKVNIEVKTLYETINKERSQREQVEKTLRKTEQRNIFQRIFNMKVY